jgi:non-ribosomal peptide synthetase component F
MGLLAAFEVLLARCSGQEDFAVGFAHNNRHRPELQGLLGMFASYMLLRSDVRSAGTFRELLARVRATCLEGFEHQALPYLELVALLRPSPNDSRHPLCQVGFDFSTSTVTQLEQSSLTLTPVPVDLGLVMNALKLYVVQGPDSLAGVFEYKADLFEPATLHALREDFLALLRWIAEDADRPLGALPGYRD